MVKTLLLSLSLMRGVGEVVHGKDLAPVADPDEGLGGVVRGKNLAPVAVPDEGLCGVVHGGGLAGGGSCWWLAVPAGTDLLSSWLWELELTSPGWLPVCPQGAGSEETAGAGLNFFGLFVCQIGAYRVVFGSPGAM